MTWNIRKSVLSLRSSDWIAIGALAISGAVGIFAYVQSEKWNQAAARIQLSEVIDKITEVDVMAATLLSYARNDDERSFIQYGLQNRKLSLISMLVESISNAPNIVSPEERAVLATHLFALGRYDEAAVQLEDFILHSKRPMERAMGQRSLAVIRFAEGRSDEGHELLEQAIETIAPVSNLHAQMYRIAIKFTLVQSMVQLNNYKEAINSIELLAHEILALPCDPTRSAMLERASGLMHELVYFSSHEDDTVERIVAKINRGNCVHDVVIRNRMATHLRPVESAEISGRYNIGDQILMVTDWAEGEFVFVVLDQPPQVVRPLDQDRLQFVTNPDIIVGVERGERGEVVALQVPRTDGRMGKAIKFSDD